MSETLVLGGGGVAGIAWTIGLLTGLADAGRDVSGADVIVGTSAGSSVGAQLALGLSLEQMYDRQVEPELMVAELAAEVDLENYGAQMTELLRGASSHTEVRQAIGAFALSAPTVPEALRRAVIESRIPSNDWPARVLRIVAVDAQSGLARVFDSSSAVGLVDAVAASCAVPGVWPPVTINGRRFIDGGMRSMANADYAAGASRVLVIVPMGVEELMPSEKPLASSVRELRAGGASVAVVAPDQASRTAIGPNPLDPSTRGASARAGREQSRTIEIAWSPS